MAVTVSPQTSIKNTGPIRRSVADEVMFISPGEIPFLTYISGKKLDISPGKFKVVPTLDNLPKSGGIRSATFEWYDQDTIPVVLTSTGNLTDSATSITITPAANAQHLTKGTILLIDSEQILVTTTGVVGGTAAISRGWAGTTAAAHTSATNDVKIIGKASVEAETVGIDPFLPPTAYLNYWTEVYHSYQKSMFDTAINRYGDNGTWRDTAVTAALRRALILFERQAVYGLKVAPAATTPGQFGGLNQFTSTQTDLSAGALTRANINTVMRTAYDAGGVENCPDTILTNSYGKVTLSNLYGNGYVTVYRQEDVTTAGYVVDEIMTDFGQLKIVMSPWVTPGDKELWFFRKDAISVGPLKNNGVDLSFKDYDLVQTATSEAGYLYGAYTMCMQRPTSRAKLYNFVSP